MALLLELGAELGQIVLLFIWQPGIILAAPVITRLYKAVSNSTVQPELNCTIVCVGMVVDCEGCTGVELPLAKELFQNDAITRVRFYSSR